MATVHKISPPAAEPVRARPDPRGNLGWRAGKPEEDPAKLKPWGFVTAKPSEYLVHVRGGRLLGRSSGQGATCFKFPWDAVAVVPTSLQRVSFQADQVTAEKVGVEVVGLAVYRIAEPLLAYRVLNFSYPERAQEKLEETLAAMFVGAARRLIANLPLEDCLQKRKSALAAELLREIAPVVGGKGSPADSTAQGWGVVIDTIEIQEVRVLS
jgi:flotillin